MSMTRLFVYGTLMPGQVRWHLLDPHVEGSPQLADVRGRLFDTGSGWPAAVFSDDDPASLVPGVLVMLDPSTADRALTLLDEVEGVASGLFSRVDVATLEGVPCCTYSWCGPTVRLQQIESWAERSGDIHSAQ